MGAILEIEKKNKKTHKRTQTEPKKQDKYIFQDQINEEMEQILPAPFVFLRCL